jgi:hypothetical protein
MYTIRTTLVLESDYDKTLTELTVPRGVDPNEWAEEVVKLRAASISDDDFRDALVSLLLTPLPRKKAC